MSAASSREVVELSDEDDAQAHPRIPPEHLLSAHKWQFTPVQPLKDLEAELPSLHQKVLTGVFGDKTLIDVVSERLVDIGGPEGGPQLAWSLQQNLVEEMR